MFIYNNEGTRNIELPKSIIIFDLDYWDKKWQMKNRRLILHFKSELWKHKKN